MVNIILKEHRIHPYHLVQHHELKETDYDRKINWVKEMVRDDPVFLCKILCMDEAYFTSSGKVNL